MQSTTAHHPLTDVQPALEQWSQPLVYSSSLCTEHEVIWYGIPLWPVWVSCPGYGPSQLLVHLLAGRALEAEKCLTQYKHCLVTTTTSVCYQHYSHTKSKTQHYSGY